MASMEPNERARVLVVANRTPATPALLDAVRARALEGPCEFALLIPAGGSRTDWTFESALPLLRRAAGRAVEALDGAEPLETVRGGLFDEAIVSTQPHKASRLLHRDLPRRIEGLGLPVTVVEGGRRPGMGVEEGALTLLTGVPRRGR